MWNFNPHPQSQKKKEVKVYHLFVSITFCFVKVYKKREEIWDFFFTKHKLFIRT